MGLRDMIISTAQKHLRFTKPSNNQIGGPCPFHKGGMETRPSFYINLENGLYFCHSCHKTGPFPNFLREMGESRKKIELAAELAQEAQPNKPVKDKLASVSRSALVSEVLLGIFDYCPVDLVREGFDKKLLRDMDIGFDKEAMRITFPIRNMYGHLVGISGRTVTNDYPRYKVYQSQDLLRFAGTPESEERAKSYTFKNHNYLWNMQNVYPKAFYSDLDTIIVVEGYKACLWLIQNGIDNTVALMGSWMSQQQEATLGRLGGSIYLFLDKNKAGYKGTIEAGSRLISRGFKVYVFEYPDDSEWEAQPDSLDRDTIIAGLDSAPTYVEWRQLHYELLIEQKIIVRPTRSRLHKYTEQR